MTSSSPKSKPPSRRHLTVENIIVTASPQFLPYIKWALCLLMLAALHYIFPFRNTTLVQSSRSKVQRDSTGKWEIFYPLYSLPEIAAKPSLIGPAQAYIETFQERLDWLDSITTPQVKGTSNLDNARNIYFHIIEQHVSALAYGDFEKSVLPKVGATRNDVMPLQPNLRQEGLDWTYLGESMAGIARLRNVRDLVSEVIRRGIPGDYIETGVWRGGASMIARATMAAFGEEKLRKIYVCDSFQGLPPGDRNMHARDSGWDRTSYLEVNEQIVAAGFQKYSLLDENVVFAKGFFNETMPHLAPQIGKLAVMRLDGDLYESTVDVLYHLYDKLSIGGYIIMDDWNNFPSKDACEDFFRAHFIQPQIIPIDQVGAYWKKTQEVKVQFWRYQQGKFKD